MDQTYFLPEKEIKGLNLKLSFEAPIEISIVSIAAVRKGF
ncbi:hypothetical protein LEP1GSC060_3402 [Leptospira weilii serovar Ranarum str. ICFT]|uniref:Uncharacterized protein n=1 Tax=Leptospira weilii serovar Ranarum str. ICFT TaxID=1218598 RepID=N1W9L7_9LEPT|nr:hypothetical protein LEP1GSC060_3402 [Leptospira weilii serovar Ranarum str. ICFT]